MHYIYIFWEKSKNDIVFEIEESTIDEMLEHYFNKIISVGGGSCGIDFKKYGDSKKISDFLSEIYSFAKISIEDEVYENIIIGDEKLIMKSFDEIEKYEKNHDILKYEYKSTRVVEFGSIYCYIGPMYAGKSKTLFRKAKAWDNYFIKPKITEQSTDNIITHNDDFYDKLEYLESFKFNSTIIRNIIKTKHICIDECQFFDPNEISTIINGLAEMNIDVRCAFLSGTFDRKSWPILEKLIPLADKVKFLRGNCYNCQHRSVFSKRVIENDDKILIDVSYYKPTCRKCFKY